jgi:cyclohexadienyl dehydratase
MNFSVAYFQTKKTALFHCSYKKYFKGVESLNKSNLRVIYNPGGTNEKYVMSHLSNTRKILHKQNLTIIEELKKKRADYFITDDIEAKLLTKRHPHFCKLKSALPNTKMDMAIIVKDNQVLKLINLAIKKIKKSKTFQDLKKRYGLIN